MTDTDETLADVAIAIQLEDADCFPTLNLQRSDYAKRLAKASAEAFRASKEYTQLVEERDRYKQALESKPERREISKEDRNAMLEKMRENAP